MSCSEPHCITCCYQRDSSQTQLFASAKKEWRAKQKWLAQCSAVSQQQHQTQNPGVLAGPASETPACSGKAAAAFGSSAGFPDTSGLSQLSHAACWGRTWEDASPPHPKCPCLQSQLAPSRLKAECQTAPAQPGWPGHLPVGPPHTTGVSDRLDIPSAVQGGC